LFEEKSTRIIAQKHSIATVSPEFFLRDIKDAAIRLKLIIALLANTRYFTGSGGQRE
jgi:hypothetical protein